MPVPPPVTIATRSFSSMRDTSVAKMPLNLTDANKVVTRAQAKAADLGIRVTVAVVDEGGLLIALARMDGAPPLGPQIAEAKAVGAAMLHRDGASLAELAKDRPGFFSVADRLVRVPMVPGLGSVLIKRDGKVLGAVGVSGGRPEQDLECAQAGLESLELQDA
ncbi:MAG: heme-binding protein [Chloroflexi bacterium]|nr:MAG: heme-binding protein [Chloroflexota bacterium]